jgi:hypothetical protein
VSVAGYIGSTHCLVDTTVVDGSEDAGDAVGGVAQAGALATRPDVTEVRGGTLTRVVPVTAVRGGVGDTGIGTIPAALMMVMV